mmetsp:Transcript_9538/g.21864  ORF Transcript_9538/g.21864 Transcript_9538/m.21864 type:complete len:213 (+) Transcript_9538:284-922(+)
MLQRVRLPAACRSMYLELAKEILSLPFPLSREKWHCVVPWLVIPSRSIRARWTDSFIWPFMTTRRTIGSGSSLISGIYHAWTSSGQQASLFQCAQRMACGTGRKKSPSGCGHAFGTSPSLPVKLLSPLSSTTRSTPTISDMDHWMCSRSSALTRRELCTCRCWLQQPLHFWQALFDTWQEGRPDLRRSGLGRSCDFYSCHALALPWVLFSWE